MAADLLVVGAGPAGTAAAITAARRGMDVVVVDRAGFPRDKTCGDGLTAGALRLLEGLGLDLGALPSSRPVDEAVLVSPSGRVVRLPLPTDGHHAAVVPRRELDAALLELARRAGATVREGVAVVGLDTTGRPVAKLDDGDTVSASWVIAADGHYSTVRRLLRPDDQPRRGEWHAARQYFRGVADRRLWVVFEEDLLPGYAWVFPLPGGRANVGFGVLRSAGLTGRRLKALWPDLLGRPSVRAALGPDAEPESRLRAWPIPARLDPGLLADGPVLFAGDAAAAVDPLTGEGIAQALETGILAAGAAAGGGTATAVADRYRRGVRAALVPDLRLAGALQRVLASPLGARASIAAAGLTPWTRRNFARWMFEDYPRAALFTPRRWRRGLFSGPGAFRGREAEAER